MVVNRHDLAATGSPKTVDFADTVKTFIYDNYDATITGVAKADITFATDFSDLSNSRYMIIVFYINKTNVPRDVGEFAGKIINEFYRIYVVTNGNEEKLKHTILEEHVYDLIEGNPLGLIASGIEDMTITDFQPVRNFQQDQNLLDLTADDNLMKASYARTTLMYEKVL